MLDGKNIFTILERIARSELSPLEMGWMLRLVNELNYLHWKQPVSWAQSTAGRGMGKNCFLRMRKRLTEEGWITVTPGYCKTTAPLYELGERFVQSNEKPKKMRTRDDIKALVIAIDQKYPEFAELCNRYTWDNALDSFKINHPDIGVWEADSIGDPVNRKQAHEMFKSLYKGKKTLNGSVTPVKGLKTIKEPKPSKPITVWTPFYLFVEEWMLTYPKRAKKSDVMAAVGEFTKNKTKWTVEQVQQLQDRILAHTAEYVKGDQQYLCAPHNYFLKEQWLEKIFRKDKDTDAKHAGSRPGMNPNFKSTVIKVN